MHDSGGEHLGDQPLLAFVHIPRTGGGSVSSAISKNYSRLRGGGNYQKGPEKTRSAIERLGEDPTRSKALGDHAPYGLYRRYLPADTRYLTILRDPVDRVLSHYHFHAQAGDPPGSAGARKLRTTWEMLLNNERLEREGGDQEDVIELDPEGDYSLEEGLRKKIAIYDNFMTRFLWGGESIFGELPPDALERAKENISSFWFVGVRERLDDSIILLGRKLGIGLMPYFLRHVSQKRPSLEVTSDGLRELIAEHNALDIELYRFARQRFEEDSPSASDLADDVQELRARSAEVTRAAEQARAAKQEANKSRRRALRIEEKGRTKHEKRTARDGPKAEREAKQEANRGQRRAERAEHGAENRARRIEQRGGTKKDKRAARGGMKTRAARKVGSGEVEGERTGLESSKTSWTKNAALAELMRPEIDALADRYMLPREAADTLQRLVRLVDWSATNFVPVGPTPTRHKQRAITDHRRAAANLIAESLAGLEVERVRAATQIADIGSGAGFPGLVLAIVLPQAQVTLIERRSQNCEFMADAIERLRLSNAVVATTRVEEWREGVGMCEVVTARKVGRMSHMIELAAPLLQPAGVLVLWPGSSDFSDEATAAASAAEEAGLRHDRVHTLESENPDGTKRLKHVHVYERPVDKALGRSFAPSDEKSRQGAPRQ
jgi:16S rRNA (guanine(527)-N(7))-methyltransferase RsmG